MAVAERKRALAKRWKERNKDKVKEEKRNYRLRKLEKFRAWYRKWYREKRDATRFFQLLLLAGEINKEKTCKN